MKKLLYLIPLFFACLFSELMFHILHSGEIKFGSISLIIISLTLMGVTFIYALDKNK